MSSNIASIVAGGSDLPMAASPLLFQYSSTVEELNGNEFITPLVLA